MDRSSNVTREAGLTSAPMACGLAWLANALLASDLEVTSAKYLTTNWSSVGFDQYVVSSEFLDHLGNHFPILLTKKNFKFRFDLKVIWEHRLSFMGRNDMPTIVVVRDPRDAIFSLYRRWKANHWIDIDFDEFLNRPSDWPDHFPGLFYLNPIKTFLLFNLIWILSERVRPVLVIHFEQMKADPKGVLEDVFDFLKVPAPSGTALEAAIQSSSAESARKVIEARTSVEVQTQSVFKGIPLEWKTSEQSEGWLKAFDSPETLGATAFLGYEGKKNWIYRDLKKIAARRRTGILTSFFLAALEWVGIERVLKQISEFEKAEEGSFKRRIQRVLKRFVLVKWWAHATVGDSAGVYYKLYRDLYFEISGKILSDHEVAFSLELTQKNIKLTEKLG